MATQLWNQEIDKTVDWGGDTSTGGAAVSGQFVQKFIKDTLAKKFGYLYYDKDALKYLVFADEDDYNAWAANPTENANLLLARFDAPAPATIQVLDTSALSVTILSSDKNQKIGFKYLVKDSSDSPITEAVNVRMLVNNGGVSQTYTFSYEVDYDNFKEGTSKEILIDDYISAGINNITLTLTGVSTQATTTITFRYTVVNLSIESTWDNTKAINFDEFKEPDALFDNTVGNIINIDFTAKGQGKKFLRIWVNGKPLATNEGGDKKGYTDNYILDGAQEYTSALILYLSKTNGSLNTDYYNFGKNYLQLQTYILNEAGEQIKSKVLYYDFVIRDVNSADDITCILYKQSTDKVFTDEDVITFNAQQYFSTSFDYSIYSSSGKSVGLTFELTREPRGEEVGPVKIATLNRTINSGEQQTFAYSFLDYGTINIKITTDITDNLGNPLDTLLVIVNVTEAGVQLSVTSSDRLLNLEALNRSNSEPNPASWEDGVTKATFENIYWNDSAGWDGETLVLNNGAICNIPYNIFNTARRDNIASLGLTFEVTFEVINVQDEDAPILRFVDDDNKSYIRMTASEARIADNSGATVHTKYNANTKIKLAFIVMPWAEPKTFDSSFRGEQKYRNCTFICVNGILDKADAYSGSIVWNNPKNPHIKLGNEDGKAGIKVYSLRVYQKALSLDEELINYIAESGDILKIWERNNVYQENTENVGLDIVKKIIPTAVLYGDLDKFNTFTDKKQNMEFDMEFYDPTDEDRDFYARGMWISNQGTSSLKYPIRNLRPYFGKTNDGKTVDEAGYWTEVYLSGEFTHGQVQDESTLGHFYTNTKSCKSGYHKLYSGVQADKLQKDDNIQLFYKDSDGNFIPCTKGVDDADADTWYIQSFREIKPYGNEGSDSDYWEFLKHLRLSGAKLHTAKDETVVNPNSDTPYTIKKFSKVKGKTALKADTTYYLEQAVWKQYEKSGYTDRWTFKADYAESSMTQNAGVGRLWGDCMKNVRVNSEYVCRTDAQSAVNDRIDIRTSCDGKPIVMFNCALKKNEDGTPVKVNGLRQYDTPLFVGLYNIMTDKSSTKLFGFEDIYDETGKLIYNAAKTECWECLSNATLFPMGLTVASDEDAENTNMADRSVWGGYEARWPDVKFKNSAGSEEQVAHTMNLESMWRFVNFCKPAVDYFVGDLDGYTLSPYSLVSEERFEEIWDMPVKPALYIGEETSGNMEYTEYTPASLQDMYDKAGTIYLYNNNYDYENVYKVESGKTIENHIYKGKVAGFDAKYGVFLEDIQFDDERVGNEANGINYEDPIKGSPVESDYYVNVYLESVNNQYWYVNENGTRVRYQGEAIDRDDYERDATGKSYINQTYMKYFSEKKYDYFNVPRLAAYYVYLMRFAAADQVVKNSMLTTEDGQHYYYINYDNDTILGTRNDGNLVFHWNITRDSYDYETSSFCFAGPKSVLWNLLECDTDFMNVVQQIDNAMYTSKVLSTDIALHMFNDLQEGTWGERLYNVNEKYKYLSQWVGDDATYLKFIHGSANQFRSWFVENRFNLYDSLWESGQYTDTSISMRMDTQGTNGTAEMFRITAARQNKFWLSNSDGRYKNLPEWKKQLDQDETQAWIATVGIYGNSSPWTLYGCDKIKVLDFRKSTGRFDLQMIAFDGPWVETKGSLMTKFLIGTSDEYIDKDTYKYTNISEEDAVLQSASLKASQEYESSTQLVGFDPEKITETEKNGGGYIYKALVDAELPLIILAPGDSYKTTQPISGYDTTKFSNETLSPNVCLIKSIGGLGGLKSLEEIDIRNCYNGEGLLNDTLDLTTLSNLHIYRAIGSSITSFVPAQGVILSEVSLPVNRINNIELNNVTFKRAENQIAPLFMYEPDKVLRTLVYNNVIQDENDKAIDVVEFVNKWIKEFKTTGETVDLKSLTLTLNGVNIEATVDWLVMLKTQMNLVSFTGDVYVIGSDEGGKLTKEEYDTLAEVFVVERPFESTSALRFTSQRAIFWNVKNANYIKVDNPITWGGPATTNQRTISRGYYEMIHGDTMNFQVTMFGIDPGTQYQMYKFDYLSIVGNNDNNPANGTWMSNYTSTAEDLQKGIYTIDNANYGFTITPAVSGLSSFSSILDGRDTRNYIRYIAIYPIDKNRNLIGGINIREDQDVIFVKINKTINPEDIILEVEGIEGDITKDSEGIYNITLDQHNKDYTVNIKYSNADQVTAVSNQPIGWVGRLNYTGEKQLSNEAVTLSKFERSKGDVKGGGSFIITPHIQPQSPEDLYISVTIPLQTGLNTKEKTIEIKLNIKTVFPNNVTIGDAANMDQARIETVTEKIDDKDTDVLQLVVNRELTENGILFPLIPINTVKNGANPNISILFEEGGVNNPVIEAIGYNMSAYLFEVLTITKENDQLFIFIKPGSELRNKAQSYDFQQLFKITGKFGYTNNGWSVEDCKDFEYYFKTDISVIYPEAIKIVFADNEENDITSTNPVINFANAPTKNIGLKLIPYNKIFTDPVTVDVNYKSIELKFVDAESNLLPDNFAKEEFVKLNIPETLVGNTPTVELVLTKNYFSDTVFNVIMEQAFEIIVNVEYKDVKNKIITVNETISSIAKQSIASYNKIDDCKPYSIAKEFDSSIDESLRNSAENFPWYFVDNSNQYYQFDKDVISKLYDAGKLNTLVGIAKRVNLGWSKTDKGFGKNAEAGGNKYNNACTSWSWNPNINALAYKSAGQGKKPENTLPVYYRALCLPLANWKFSEEQLTKGKAPENGFIRKQNNLSAFFIPFVRLGDEITLSTTLTLIDSPLKGYKILPPSYDASNYKDTFATWLSLMYVTAMHKSILSINSNWVSGVIARPIDDLTLEDNNFSFDNGQNTSNTQRWGSFSFIDAKEAMKCGFEGAQLEIIDYVKANNAVADIRSISIEEFNSVYRLSSIDKDKIIFNGCFNEITISGSTYYPGHLNSALLHIWNHFKLFDINVTDKNPSIDNSHIKCYMTSGYELTELFNDDQCTWTKSNTETNEIPYAFKLINTALKQLRLTDYLPEENIFISTFVNNFNDAVKNYYTDSGTHDAWGYRNSNTVFKFGSLVPFGPHMHASSPSIFALSNSAIQWNTSGGWETSNDSINQAISDWMDNRPAMYLPLLMVD